VIFRYATARRLATARIFVLSLWLWEIWRDEFPQLAALSPQWFTRHGPWLIVPDSALVWLWDETWLTALRAASAACVTLALLGVRAHRYWMLSAIALLTLTTSFVRGFGHADHAQVQLLLVTLLLAVAPAWDALALHPYRGPERNPGVYPASFAMIALVFAFPYLETAVHRLAREGAGLFFGSSILHFLARDTLSLDDFNGTAGLWLVERNGALPAYNLGFALVTLAELLSPLSHLHRRWCALWLCVLLPFHLLAPLLMHVLFGANIALLALLYLWPLCWQPPSRPGPVSSRVRRLASSRVRRLASSSPITTAPASCSRKRAVRLASRRVLKA
jgi:hypothetical protein